jgi:hypothetical protein
MCSEMLISLKDKKLGENINIERLKWRVDEAAIYWKYLQCTRIEIIGWLHNMS